MSEARFAIAGREIGPGNPIYVIAELSANHNQDLSTAMDLVRAAAAAGADAIKLQTYTPDSITIDCKTEPFRIREGTPWEGTILYDLYEQAYMPWEWQPGLAKLARELGLHCFSTPFDEVAVDFLEEMHVPAYKVASFELVDIPLLRKVASTGRPVILSTGMAQLAEIEEAVTTLRDAGVSSLALLRTNSGYPATPDEIHLRSIRHLAEIFSVVVGLSDHTLGIAVPVAAVAVGAHLIEKHLTLSRAVPGPDSSFSLEPNEFKAMVEAVRVAEKALGHVRFGPTEGELPSLEFRRSLFVVADIKENETFTRQNVRSIRPAAGLHTRYLAEILGRRASRDVTRGTPLSWDLIE